MLVATDTATKILQSWQRMNYIITKAKINYSFFVQLHSVLATEILKHCYACYVFGWAMRRHF